MKRLLSIVALLIVSVAVMPIAEAKKFGGGKSLGKSYKPHLHQNNSSRIPTPSAKIRVRNRVRRKVSWAELRGLLAGGLLAAFFGGAFEGIQFMDILIIGLIAFIIFKLMRSLLAAKQGSMNQHRQQPAFGGQAPKFEQANVHNFEQTAGSSSNGSFGFANQSDVPHNYPPGFDQVAFVNGAREHYRTLQGAWNHNQLDTIEEYVSPTLFADLKAEREKLAGEQHTEVMYVDAQIVRAEYDDTKAQLSLQFSGRYRDAVEGIEEDIEDIWHLERDLTQDNAPWLIVGIQG